MLINTKYMVAVSRFITRLHTGQVDAAEVRQISVDTAAACGIQNGVTVSEFEATKAQLAAKDDQLTARDNELMMVMKQLEKFSFMADQQTGNQRTLVSISLVENINRYRWVKPINI